MEPRHLEQADSETNFFEFDTNGWIYEAFTSSLGRRFQGGSPDDHILVTVFGPPFGRAGRSFCFGKMGTLYDRYVAEKLELDMDDPHLWAYTRLIAFALSREPISVGLIKQVNS